MATNYRTNPKEPPMTNTPTPDTVTAIADLARSGCDVDALIDDMGRTVALYGAYPPGWAIQHLEVNLEQYAGRPRRKKAAAQVRDTVSLLAYIERQVIVAAIVDEELPTIWTDPDALTAVAVFNGHTTDGPGWSDHTCTLTLGHTPEWNAWADIDQRFVSAGELAEFVEQWRHTIAAPPTADLLDLVRSFRATQTATFRQELVDASGDRALEYVVETTAQAGRTGQLPIPAELTLAVAPFTGADPVAITARFRYRMRDGAASFGVVLLQPNLAAEQAFAAEVDRIGGHAPYVIINGTPGVR